LYYDELNSPLFTDYRCNIDCLVLQSSFCAAIRILQRVNGTWLDPESFDNIANGCVHAGTEQTHATLIRLTQLLGAIGNYAVHDFVS
jgi:hypothetical protein